MKRTYANIDKDIETSDQKGDKNEFETDITIKVTKNNTSSFIHDDNSNNQSLEIIPYVYSPIRDYYSSDEENSNLGENEETHCKSVVNDDNNKELNIGNNSNFESNNDNESSASNELYTIDLTNIEDVIAQNNTFLENLTSNNRPENFFTVIKSEFQENDTFNENSCNTIIPQMTVSGSSLQNTETKLPLNNLTVETQISSQSSKIQLKPSRIYMDCEEQNNNDDEILRDTREISRVLQKPSELYKESSQDHQEEFNNEKIPNVQQESPMVHPNLNEVIQEPSQSHQTIQQEQSVVHQETSRLPHESSIVQKEQFTVSQGPSPEYQEQSNIQQVISSFPQGNDEIQQKSPKVHHESSIVYQGETSTFNVHQKPSNQQETSNVYHVLSGSHQGASRALQQLSRVQLDFGKSTEETSTTAQELYMGYQKPSNSQQNSIVYQSPSIIHEKTPRVAPIISSSHPTNKVHQVPQDSPSVSQQSIVPQEASRVPQVPNRVCQDSSNISQEIPRVHSESSFNYQKSRIYVSKSAAEISTFPQELSRVTSWIPQHPSRFHQHPSKFPQDQTRVPQDQSRVAQNQFTFPQDQSRDPQNKTRLPLDQSRFPQKQSKVPQDQSRFRQDQSRFRQDQSRFPHDHSRVAQDQYRFPHDQSRFPKDQSRFHHDQSRVAQDQSTFPQDQSRVPQNQSRFPQDQFRVAEEQFRVARDQSTFPQDPQYLSRFPQTQSRAPQDQFSVPYMVSQEYSRASNHLSRVTQVTSRVRQYPTIVREEPSRIHQKSSSVYQEHSSVHKEPTIIQNVTSRNHQDHSRFHEESTKNHPNSFKSSGSSQHTNPILTCPNFSSVKVSSDLPSTSTQTTNVPVDLQSNSNTGSLSSPIQPNNLHTEISVLKNCVIPILQNVLSQQNKISIGLNPEISNLRNMSTDKTTTPINIQSLFNISIYPDKNYPNSTSDSTENNLQGPSNVTSTKQKTSNDLNSRNCTICMEPFGEKPVASTTCGHIFCMACIQETFITTPKRCPTCRKKLTDIGYHRLFF